MRLAVNLQPPHKSLRDISITSSNADTPLTLAVPKGRILEDLRPLFAHADIDLAAVGSDRKLVYNVADGAYRVLLVRASDVPTYVAYGVADAGIVGADTLLEENSDLVEPLDLGIGECRMVVAAPNNYVAPQPGARVKVASKYPNIARRHFRARGIDAIIIKLYGSVELACLSGLADVVVDLVSTGATLKANQLKELETIMSISTRLVVNRASLKTRYQQIDTLLAGLSQALTQEKK